MAVIYYRFRSQKPTQISTVAFDGTGLTVFELKREIIAANRLFTASDVDIGVFSSEDTEKQYEDDNEVIPRSSTVIVRRTASQRKGRGNISRYLAGRPRLNKSQGTSTAFSAGAANNITGSTSLASAGGSEQDAIQKMFADQEDQWSQQQSVMATATRIDTPRTNAKLDESIPDYYICYKCGEKGKHHIRNCPKNNDANWEGVRIKKTTGIPKSYLKTVEVDPSADGVEEGRNYMVNEDGKYVVQVADTRSWQQFQAAASTKNKKGHGTGDPLWETPVPNTPETPDNIKELRDENDSNGTVWRNPVLLPCCNKRFSKQYIEEKLIDNDFRCPSCQKEEIYLDLLIPDDDMQKRIEEYIEERRKNPSLLQSSNNIKSAAVPVNAAIGSVKEVEGQDGDQNTMNAKRQQLNPVGMMPGMMPMPMMPGMMPMPFMPFMPGMMPPNMMNQTSNQKK